MPRQGPDLTGGCARGGLRLEPTEDLPLCHQAGAQAEAREPMHYCAQGDLHAQVLHPQAGAQASAYPLVSGLHPRCAI